MLTNSWKVGDFFYVPKNLQDVEYFGVFTEHGSVLIMCSEKGNEIRCSENGVKNPIPNAVTLGGNDVDQIEGRVITSDNLISLLYTIHASSTGKLPFGRPVWPVAL